MLALEGLRALELGSGIAGSYATKLLALLGAEVVKVEPPGGDPIRTWGPFAADKVDREAGGGLFRFLNADKHSVILDLRDGDALADVRMLCHGVDLVVEQLGAGALEAIGLDDDARRAANPRLGLVRISPFGQHGPYARLPATPIVVQAMGGWIGAHGVPGTYPVQTGGHLDEFTVGAYAACAALTVVRAAAQRGEPVTADLAALEAMIGTLPYPMLLNETYSKLGLPIGDQRYSTLPGIVRCKDGWVGINALTGQHFQDICAMLGLEDYAGRQVELAGGGPELEQFFARMQPWLDVRTVDEIVGLCQAFRIPAAPVGDGEKLTHYAQFVARPFYEPEPGGDLPFPGPPWRLGATPARCRRRAPRLSEATDTAGALARLGSRRDTRGDPGGHKGPRPAPPGAPRWLPFEGLRVVDLGTFWAGPYVGMYLGAFGADVVKVESVQRPDGFRFSGAFPQEGPDWYDRGGIWQATNLDKRDVTLDLTRPKGKELVERLIAGADVVIENYSARVVESFGLGYERVRELRRDVIMLRMPAYGLSGPWRDYVGWAMGIEQASGMAQVTGHPDRPMHPGGFADPMIAMHAAVAVQAALAHRERTGEGQLIEVAQIETACNLTADQVMDFALNQRLATRLGNRNIRAAPQGVYPTADGRYVALTVRNDAEWELLVEELGRPLWVTPQFATLTGRLTLHDEIDEHLGEWTSARTADDVVSRLRARGIPVGAVLQIPEMYDEPQLNARGYYVPLENAKTGVRRYPGWPMQFSFTSLPHRRGAPTLGEHNREVLGGELRLSGEELAALEADAVIGTRMLGT